MHYNTQVKNITVFPNKLAHRNMNKTVIITGGAKGIGRCIVEKFASSANKVYFIDYDRQATQAFIAYAQEKQWHVNGYVGDIAEKEVLKEFAHYVLTKEPEGIDYLINNACLMNGGILDGCDYEEFLYVQRVGVVAPYMLTKLFQKHFRTPGSIVNISSTRAFQSQPNTESYSAAKGGITALTHALAISLAGIARVNSIAPGWIDTVPHSDGETSVPPYSANDINQHPSRRIGTPDDIARVVEFLCDDRNAFINGENIIVDGGMSKLMIYHNDYGWKYNP